MPVFNCNIALYPIESEVEIVKIIHLSAHDVFTINDHQEKEKIFIGKGKVLLKSGNGIRDYNKNDVIAFNKDDNKLKQVIAFENSIIIRIGGSWNNHSGTCGVFELTNSESPKNNGDLTEYERNTEFDNHFHDCDEFWVLFEGEGEIVTEGNRYKVKAGDCVFTKAGDHHDFPIVNKTIKGVWFETSYIGKKREGHLWNHTHNKTENENEL